MTAAEELGQTVGVVASCQAMGVSRATLYRRRKPPPVPPSEAAGARPRSHRALTGEESARVLDTLNSDRFADQAPAEVYATLLDEGDYLCSIRTMYRVLEEHGQVRERRNQLRHPAYTRPELLATSPNQLWSWDITKLKGPRKWSYFYLYVILDVFSRYVVGWMVAECESATLANKLISESLSKQDLDPEHLKQLVIHADRGTSMKSKLVAQLLADLGVTKTHSRPHTSDDNPFSESQFKTLKYRPGFPNSFGSIEDALAFCRAFFHWYNHEHHHHGISLLTPTQVHYGTAQAVLSQRQQVMDAVFQAHPERFKKAPLVPQLPQQVWINPPRKDGGDQSLPGATCDSSAFPGDCSGTASAEIEKRASIASSFA